MTCSSGTDVRRGSERGKQCIKFSERNDVFVQRRRAVHRLVIDSGSIIRSANKVIKLMEHCGALHRLDSAAEKQVSTSCRRVPADHADEATAACFLAIKVTRWGLLVRVRV